jgi:hypothetical protein
VNALTELDTARVVGRPEGTGREVGGNRAKDAATPRANAPVSSSVSAPVVSRLARDAESRQTIDRLSGGVKLRPDEDPPFLGLQLWPSR